MQAAPAAQRVAQVIQGGRIIRLERQRPAVGCNGLVGPARGLQNQAEIAAQGGVRGCAFDRGPHQLDGFFHPTVLPGQHAESV